MKNTRGSEWNKWDLHIHTASSYDSPYKADDADELLCQALAENDIKLTLNGRLLNIFSISYNEMATNWQQKISKPK